MSRLTTHVLDTAHGRPAAGMAVALWIDGEPVARGVTDADGRCPGLTREVPPGRHRLTFEVAAYFRAMEVALPDPPFLDTVSIEFGVSDAASHYHVPLLVSPFAYSTYRGS